MYNGWGIFCEVEDYLSWLYIHGRWRHQTWHNNVYYVHASRVNGAYFARLKIISLHYTYIGDSSLQFLRYRLCFSSFEIVGVRLRKHGNRSGSCILNAFSMQSPLMLSNGGRPTLEMDWCYHDHLLSIYHHILGMIQPFNLINEILIYVI